MFPCPLSRWWACLACWLEGHRLQVVRFTSVATVWLHIPRISVSYYSRSPLPLLTYSMYDFQNVKKKKKLDYVQELRIHGYTNLRIAVLLSFSNIKRLATATFSFWVWILKGKFRGKFAFLPVHGGANYIKECHGFDKHCNTVSLHFFLFFLFLKGIIECVR